MSNPYIGLQNDLVYALNQVVTAPGSLGIGLVKDEGKVRFVITGAGASNVIQIRGGINNQATWNTLAEFTGNVNELVEVFTYDQVEVLCVVFEAANGHDFKIVASSFDSNKLTIETPDGTLDNFNTLTFESSDNSIEIVADPLTGTIDFTTGETTGVTSVNGRTGDVILDKSDVNLDQVDNTSDADKPISDATQAALDLITDVNWTGDYNNGVTYNVGDGVMFNGASFRMISFIGAAGYPPPSYPGSWLQVTDYVSANDIGLDQVDNTSDADKPISDATQIALDDKVAKAGDTMTGQLTMLDTSVVVDGSITQGYPSTVIVATNNISLLDNSGVDNKETSISAGEIALAKTNVPSSTSDTTMIIGTTEGTPYLLANNTDYANDASSQLALNLQSLGVTYNDNVSGVSTNGVYGSGSFIIQTTQPDSSYTAIEGSNAGIAATEYDGTSLTPLLPTQPEHLTVKKYVDDADALKEDLANKSIDGTLSTNSDTLYPSEKAVKTYVDLANAVSTANFEASTYYHELHVNYDFTGATSDGSPYKPFKTTQAAVNAAQLQNVGGNTAILIHLKNDITMVENITVNNAVSNLYIMPAVRNNTSSGPFKIIGSLTISGSQTNRVRVQDIEFAPTSGYALVINDTPGRHLFENCAFVNGSVAGQVGTGVNLTSTYRNFIEFVDCTIEGTLNIAGTPVAGTTIAMYRCKLSYANVIVNSANVAVGMYDTYGIYGITHTAGALAITGMWGFAQTGFFNSTAALSGINFLSIANASLQKPDLSFIPLNKTGTCFYQLINVHRGETVDVLSGGRFAFGPTATDAGYKMGVSGNWSPAVSNVAGALDQLAANKISTSQKGVANGVASLDGSGKVPAAQLPAYVDDVLEFANLAAFPVTGSTGIIYVALDTNLCYRWSGSTYIEISPAPVTSVNGQTNAVSLDALDIPFTPTSTITSTNVQDAIEEVEANSAASTAAIFEDTREPTGFINRTDSTISFVDGTRIFTIAPVSTSFSFYIKGEKFTKTTAQSITIPNLTGTHYIYFNTSGALETTQVPSADIFEIDAIIAFVYWNNETNLSTLFGEERHGITMDGATHSYLHTILGARYLSGLALQNFTIGSGNSNADAQFTSDEGSIRDEDILHTIPAQTQIPILYRQGQYWRRKVADAYPLIYSGSAGYTGANGRPAYNQYTGGAWQLTEMTNTDFILVHFFGTNDVNNKVIGVVGTQQYASRSAARTGANSEISKLQDLPFTEFVPIGTVIFQSNNYTNAVKARVVTTDLGENYVDFRGTQVYTPAGEASDHGLLSGLVDDDHIQYHTDARGDIRYYTKAEVDSLITGISSPGDIDEKSFNISNSQALPDNVDDFLFANAVVRGFTAFVTVQIDATTNLFEQFTLNGVQRDSSWGMSVESEGDDSGIVFSITSAGQIQYTSQNYTGFVSGTIKFRAITTSI
jgi:hypothetical protein